jgi:hypothetical protein
LNGVIQTSPNPQLTSLNPDATYKFKAIINGGEFEVTGEKEISLRYSINRTDSDQVVICTLKALDQDKSVVGQIDDTIPAGERISQRIIAIPTRSAPLTASIARCRAE